MVGLYLGSANLLDTNQYALNHLIRVQSYTTIKYLNNDQF